MTARASDLAARFATSAAGTRGIPESAQPHPENVQELRGKPVSPIMRLMVKMPKSQHRFIRQFALDNESDASTIVRTLLGRIETDPVFAEELRTILREAR